MLTNEQTYREMLERLIKAYDSGVAISSDKTGYWNVFQEARELLKRPAPEPTRDPQSKKEVDMTLPGDWGEVRWWEREALMKRPCVLLSRPQVHVMYEDGTIAQVPLAAVYGYHTQPNVPIDKMHAEIARLRVNRT